MAREAVPACPSPATVTWRYIGAHTVHRWEKRDAWTIAAARSAGWMVRSALVPGSVETVGDTEKKSNRRALGDAGDATSRVAPLPATEVAARLDAHGSGVWPGRHSQTVFVGACDARTAAPAPGASVVTMPVMTKAAAATVVARNERAERFPIA